MTFDITEHYFWKSIFCPYNKLQELNFFVLNTNVPPKLTATSGSHIHDDGIVSEYIYISLKKI